MHSPTQLTNTKLPKRRHIFVTSFGFIILLCILISPNVVTAQARIELVSSSTKTHFPEGIHFQVTARSPATITDITLRYRVAGARYERYSHFDFTHGKRVASSLLLRTDTASRYIPPGAVIEYFYEISDETGNLMRTEPARWVYLDPRFEWKQLKGEEASIYYYGGQAPPLPRKLLEAAHETLGSISAILGIDPSSDIHMTLYNTSDDMKDALPPRSAIQEDALVVEGMYFPETNVILVLADTRRVVGVTSHEIVHFLIDQVLDGNKHFVPAWLNEGLAEYANPESSPSFRIALSTAIRDNEVFPLTSLSRPPGKPEDVILFYAQSESIVAHLINTHGKMRFQSLINNLREGKGIDIALMKAYELDRQSLENEWRTTVGLPAAITKPTLIPTAIPLPTIVPYGVPTSSAIAAQASEDSGTIPETSRSSGFCNQSTPSIEIGLLFMPIGLATILRSLKRARRRQFGHSQRGIDHSLH